MKALRFSVSVPQYTALKALGRINTRLYYQSPLATIRLADVPVPVLPSPDWIKLRTLFCGFCGSDMSLILLKDSPMATPFTSFPCTPGHEISAEVVEVGANVSGIKKGDIVTVIPTLSCAVRGIEPECRSCRTGRPSNCENFAEGKFAPGLFLGICRDLGGGFAPYLVAHKSQALKLPAEIPPRAGALMEPLAVCIQVVLDNMPNSDDRVLIVGAGFIGNLLIQTLRAFGIKCPITAAEPSRFHAQMALQAGADNLITSGDSLRQAEKITGAKLYKPMLGRKIAMGGFSKIFDTVASSHTLDTDLRILRTGGVLSIVGIGKETMKDPTPLWLKLQTVKGVYCFGYNTLAGKREHAFETAIRLAQQNKVRLEPMISHAFALEDYRKMIGVNLHKGKYKAIKTVVAFS
ncbi:MAG: zinc-binding dehydrogenase [Chloroflexi bacterium]|nr:zinc-binding dehydrogenase [Chloroflexota bacterium]